MNPASGLSPVSPRRSMGVGLAVGLAVVLSIAPVLGDAGEASGPAQHETAEPDQTVLVQCEAADLGCGLGLAALVQHVARAAVSSYQIAARQAALDVATMVPGVGGVASLAAQGSLIAREATADAP